MLDESSSTTGSVCDVLEEEFIVLFLLQHSASQDINQPDPCRLGLERLLLHLKPPVADVHDMGHPLFLRSKVK